MFKLTLRIISKAAAAGAVSSISASASKSSRTFKVCMYIHKKEMLNTYLDEMKSVTFIQLEKNGVTETRANVSNAHPFTYAMHIDRKIML